MMKDTMKIFPGISIFLACIFFVIQVQAQSDCWGHACNELSVMAPSGLSLRTIPQTNGKRLLVIPFGMKVKNHGVQGGEVRIGGIESTWMKITYKGTTGYAFGAYLSSVEQVPSTDINKEVRLDFGMHCDGQVNFDPALNWYGLYWDGEKQVGSLQKITPQLMTAENATAESMEMIDYELKDVSKKGDIQFMFGSKKELGQQKLVRSYTPKTWINLARKDTSIELRNMRLTAKATDSFKEEFHENSWSTHYTDLPAYEIKIHLGSRTQVLSVYDTATWNNRGETNHKKYYLSPVSVRFAADLDGDGITDLLIRVGSEESGNNRLFLSSYAEEGEILKEVADRGDSYCC